MPNDRVTRSRAFATAAAEGFPEFAPEIALLEAGYEITQLPFPKEVDDAFRTGSSTSSPTKTQYPKNTSPDMSYKSQRTSHFSVPGRTTRNNPSYGYQTDAKRKKTSVKLIKQSGTKFNQNAISKEQNFYDAHLLFTEGEKRLTPLKLHLSKREFPDSITNFLASMMQKASLSFQFAGRIVTAVNQRSAHVQHFRHSLSVNANATGASWPSNQRNFILQPVPGKAFNIAGDNFGNTEQQIPTNSGTFLEMLSGQEYWAGISRPDLEDMMWRLNTLKLGQIDTSATQTGPPFASHTAPALAVNNHARLSELYVNNISTGSYTSNTNASGQPFRYNAVFNDGSVTYDFMNKGPGGCKIEVIVYRMKKHVRGYNTPASYDAPASGTGTSLDLVINPLGTAYVSKTLGLLATDAFTNGKPPLVQDVFNSPGHPFLPPSNLVKGIDMPYSELGRQTFGMPSGARRSVTLQFGGNVYDPVYLNSQGSTASQPSTPILDHHSYMVVIGVSGCKGSQIYTVGANGGPPDAPAAGQEYIVGDNFCAADVQFYGTYKEDIQAVQFKKPGRKAMFCNGQLLAPYSFPVTLTPDADTSQATGAMLPQGMAVRIPAHNTQTYDSSGVLSGVHSTPATDSTVMDTNVEL